jgi:hypothetical protein
VPAWRLLLLNATGRDGLLRLHFRKCPDGRCIDRQAADIEHRSVARGSNLMGSKGWLQRFDEPIVLDDGTTLSTLRDAIQYLAKTVAKAEQNHESVLNAADHLTRSAEQGYPLFFARAATLQAIHRNKDRVFNPDRKDHHWGKRKLKRDQ